MGWELRLLKARARTARSCAAMERAVLSIGAAAEVLFTK